MNKEQKKELVISLAQGVELVVQNHLSNPSFNGFATDANIMAILAAYTDLRDAGVTMGTAFNGIMNAVDVSSPEEEALVEPLAPTVVTKPTEEEDDA